MTHQTDYTRLGIILVLACSVGYLSHQGGYNDLVKSIVAAMIALAMGFLRSPTQINRRATDVPPPEDPHVEP